MSNNKSRSNRPYDPSNSFVKKVASRVSGLLPKSTSWLSTSISGWFASAANSDQDSSNIDQVNNEEENFEDALEKQPPNKRFKLSSNQQHHIDAFPSCHNVPEGEGSSRLIPNNFIDTSAIPGPSGLGARSGSFVASTPAVTSVNHLEPKANGDDCSESGESTSGCSSLEPQINRAVPSSQNQSRQNDSLSPRRRLLADKFNYSCLQSSRSLYLDRSSNQTVGRRNNPSFCVNTFGTPLFGERGSVNDLILNSPFYSGRTTYGGASSASYRRSLGSASLSSSPANSEKFRHTIKVKPGNAQPVEDSSMSQTAKRILATLEQFSTPILDAKRIPVAQEPVLATLGSRKRTRVDDAGTSQLVLEQPNVPKRTASKPMHWAKGAPRTSQLTFPVTPDTLILKRRELVQEPTSAAKSLSTDSYILRTENDSSNSARNTLKMRPRITDENKEKPEMPTEVNLPDVPLQISSLPTFDINVPAPQLITNKPLPSSAPSFGSNALIKPLPVNKISSSPSVPSSKLGSEAAFTETPFSFSSPIPVLSGGKDQPLSPINNFTFSEPLPASMNFLKPSSNCVKARPKASVDSPKQSDSVLCGLKPASELKTGSVMDILGKSKNDMTKKVSLSTTESFSLMDKLKPAAGSWDCKECWAGKKAEATPCAACSSSREAKKAQATELKLATPTTTSSSACPKADADFGAEFKLSQGMWECSTCLVRNKALDSKCASCTAPKPGSTIAATCVSTAEPFAPTPAVQSSWGDLLKKPEGSWTCSGCFVPNKATDMKCVCCSSLKPGSKNSQPSSVVGSQFNFGIPAAAGSESPASAFSFGIPKDKKEVSEEKSSVSSSTGFKLGENKSESTAAVFSFGVPLSTAPSVPVTSSSSFFGSPSFSSMSENSPVSKLPPVPDKIVGSPATSQSVAPPQNDKPPSFSFGVPASTDDKTDASSIFTFSKSPVSAAITQPVSSTASPLAGKRKLGDDAPSSSALPLKFGVSSNETSVGSQASSLGTSTSSVSSTSGPVFAFSASSSTTSSSASPFSGHSVTSTANGQAAPASSIFSNLVSSPSSTATPKSALPFGLSASSPKDESVTSTWKTSTNDESKPGSDVNGAPAVPKPSFSFGSSVSSSEMAFGSNAIKTTANFSFGAEKTNISSKPLVSFGPSSVSPSTGLFGMGSGSGKITGAAPSFGTPNSTGFGSLAPSSNSTFPPSNSIVPNIGAPAFSAFAAPEEKKPAFSLGASEPPVVGFAFSAPSDDKKPFTFGSSQDAKKPAFAFSATASTTAQNSFSSPFTFSSSTSAPAPAPAPAANGPVKPNFSFGGSQPSSFPSFSPQQQPPATSGVFNFGSTAPFTFGAANNTQTPVPTPSPFGGGDSSNAFATPNLVFGSSNPQLSSGFNFQAPATPTFGTQNQPAGFTFSETKPSFNFTSGNHVNFSASQEGSGPQTGRIIKKAARRTKR